MAKNEELKRLSPPPFIGDHNCAYTTSGGQVIKTSIHALLNIMKSIPEKPRILTMDIEVIKNRILPKNTMVISSDIAEAMEQALAGKSKGEQG